MMKLSKFFQSVKINEKIYAIYNNLYMKIIFVDKEKYKKIKLLDVSKEEKDILMECKIYVNGDEDAKLLAKLNNEKNKELYKIKNLYLCVTSSCNLCCKYCFINNQLDNKKITKTMDKEIGEIAIKRFSEYLIKKKLKGKVIFYGGEPLMNWSLIRHCVEYATVSNYPITFSVVTNGTLLDDEKINFFKENNVDIGISIDGPKKINDASRHSDSCLSVYDTVIPKVFKLKESGCKFGLSLTISEDVLKNQKCIIKWLKSLDIRNISYNLLHFTWEYPNWKKYYEEATEFVLRSYCNLGNCTDGLLQKKINCVINRNFKFFSCSAIGLRQITVNPDGNVCICHGEFENSAAIVSNIHNFDFDGISEVEKLNGYTDIVPLNNSRCLRCRAIFLCGGGCVLQARKLFGSKSTQDKAMCIFNRKVAAFILKRIYDITNSKEVNL